VARRSWYVNVWGTLIRAYSENEGVSPYLGDFHTAQLADNVAAVMLRLPRLQGSILKSAGLDAKNLELLTRGRPMQRDDVCADAELRNDSQPRLVKLIEPVSGSEDRDGSWEDGLPRGMKRWWRDDETEQDYEDRICAQECIGKYARWEEEDEEYETEQEYEDRVYAEDMHRQQGSQNWEAEDDESYE
jgi:hypothetical protein